MKKDVYEIKKSHLTGLIAEVFYEELAYVLKEEENEQEFWIKSRGMNSRASAKDVVDLSSYNYLDEDGMKSAVFIHLSRNSIYHQLPEIFFHPLTIGGKSMSNREIVDAVRENKKKEADNIQFFMPFDTELFTQKVKLTNRHLNIFTDTYAKENLFLLSKALIGDHIQLSKEQYYKLFLHLCNAESLKEELPLLEELLHEVMGFEVRLTYAKKTHLNSPFDSLGAGVLGFTFGLQGVVESEQDDIHAQLIMEEEINYKNIEKNKKIVRQILDYFIFANREIVVSYTTKETSSFHLSQNFLGYDIML